MRAKIGMALAGVLVMAVVVSIAWALSTPQLINYQGRLTDEEGTPLDGTSVDLTFAFYGVETGGTAYLTVLQEDVVVTGGIYNLLLGSGTITPGTEPNLGAVFQNHSDVWMAVKVDTGAEMTPRARMASVPYSLSVDVASIYSQAWNNPDYDNDGSQSPLVGGDDCNDNDPYLYAGATEICDDGRDNDCDRLVDTDDPDDCCHDVDLDLFYTLEGCGATVDCDDSDPYTYPGAEEICDGLDNQCPGDTGHGQIDEDCRPHSGMALIPAGCFDMGDSFAEGNTNELPVHNVCITSDFYMEYHEVTNLEYEDCVTAEACTTPSDVSSSTRAAYFSLKFSDYDNYPVIYITRDQAEEYCSWVGKRLPTEAEWEYAARGGLAGKRYVWGDTITGAEANYWASGDPWDNDTSPVGYYAKNGYGLMDMLGNVFEYVSDWYQEDYYSVSPQNDPPGPATGSWYVIRGGAWSDALIAPNYMRVASKFPVPDTNTWMNTGTRCAADELCPDQDGDTFSSQAGCGPLDCNDLDPSIYPGATEQCDGVDNQCSGDPGHGQIDEDCPQPPGTVLIPGGCFEMGDAFSEGDTDELPVHTVCITSEFYIYQYPVTNVQYRDCVANGPCTDPVDNSSATRPAYYPISAYDDFPVIYVNWTEAGTYCEWVGMRLPTEAEWEYAARGGVEGKRYPWGDTFMTSRANSFNSGDPWDNDTSDVSGHLVQNGYQLHDMVGNVSEWVNDWYQSDYYTVSPQDDPPGPEAGTHGIIRGGNFADTPGFLRAAHRTNVSRGLRHNEIGFRCARD